MVTFCVIMFLADSLSRSWNKTGQLFGGFRPEPKAWTCVVGHNTSTDGGRLDHRKWGAVGYFKQNSVLCIHSTFVGFFGYGIKTPSVVVRLLALVPSEGFLRLANGASFNGNSWICWTLVSGSFIPSVTSGGLEKELLNMSTSETEPVLMRITIFKGFLSTAVWQGSFFDLAAESIVGLFVIRERLEMLWDSIKVWYLPNRQRDGFAKCDSVQAKR